MESLGGFLYIKGIRKIMLGKREKRWIIGMFKMCWVCWWIKDGWKSWNCGMICVKRWKYFGKSGWILRRKFWMRYFLNSYWWKWWFLVWKVLWKWGLIMCGWLNIKWYLKVWIKNFLFLGSCLEKYLKRFWILSLGWCWNIEWFIRRLWNGWKKIWDFWW